MIAIIGTHLLYVVSCKSAIDVNNIRETYHIIVRITVPTESEPAMTFENVQAVEAL